MPFETSHLATRVRLLLGSSIEHNLTPHGDRNGHSTNAVRSRYGCPERELVCPTPGRDGEMAAQPRELKLTLTPRSRYDAIDVAARVREEFGDVLIGFRRVLYCSLHTTAGYLEQSLSSRLDNRRERLDPFMRAFQGLFPPGADYRHDQLHLRSELSEDERQCEPRNADSHLTFIGSGLRNCVTYLHRPSEPVYFTDLDGVHAGQPRTRCSRVLG
jgi:hypothetical protein